MRSRRGHFQTIGKSENDFDGYAPKQVEMLNKKELFRSKVRRGREILYHGARQKGHFG